MSIIYIEQHDLSPGALIDIFKSGAIAVILKNDPRIGELWSALLAPNTDTVRRKSNEILPWEGSFLDIVKNFHPDLSIDEEIGDCIYGRPGCLTYIARKVSLSRPSDWQDLVCVPDHFYVGDTCCPLDTSSMELVWTLGSEILRSLQLSSLDHSMHIHRLRYESSVSELNKRISLLEKAMGLKSQNNNLYHRLATTTPHGSKRILNIVKRHPWLRRTLARTPEVILRVMGLTADEDGTIILGEAHTDERIFAGLIADRSNVVTEVWCGNDWRQLPLAKDRMAIVLGRKAQEFLDLSPTWHRVILNDGCRNEQPFAELSMLLGA